MGGRSKSKSNAKTTNAPVNLQGVTAPVATGRGVLGNRGASVSGDNSSARYEVINGNSTELAIINAKVTTHTVDRAAELAAFTTQRNAELTNAMHSANVGLLNSLGNKQAELSGRLGLAAITEAGAAQIRSGKQASDSAKQAFDLAMSLTTKTLLAQSEAQKRRLAHDEAIAVGAFDFVERATESEALQQNETLIKYGAVAATIIAVAYATG